MEQEFIRLIKENERILQKICNLYCREAADQEDLYQDIVIQLWEAFPRFNQQAKVSTWLYRIALNTAITRYRKVKKHPRTEGITDRISSAVSPVSDSLNETNRQLYAAIESLTKVEKAITLLYMEGAKYQEIAEVIGISESNVGFKLNRIKKKLRTTLQIKEL
ncbi:MAG: sigma-70 family RNA polymerase sigma factor [Bacteroidota bacterium]